MNQQTIRLPNFVIGGTEKSGTTSVFMYLSAHPQVCGSSVKETDFFREHYQGSSEVDRQNYSKYFSRCTAEKSIVMEASPGYLGAGLVVAPRMKTLIPDAKILFILRDPIDRLYSSFQFHKSKLEIDQSISFDEFVQRCIRFDSGEATPAQLGVGEWFLKNLGFGRYVIGLEEFLRLYPRAQVKVMLFEDLNRDVKGFMREVCQFMNIDPGFFETYEFKKTNVTFSSKNSVLHKLALWLNSIAEPVLRQRPQLKEWAVSTYKRFNQRQEGYDPMPATARAALQQYYAASNRRLAELLPDARAPWLR